MNDLDRAPEPTEPTPTASDTPLAEHDPRQMFADEPELTLERASEGIDASVIRWSRKAGPGDRVVLLLHGLGADERDLVPLVPSLPDDFVYASVRGIFTYGQGYAWLNFPLDETARAHISVSAAAVEGLIDAIAQAGAQVVGVIGFSQGAMLTYELIRRRPGSLQFIAPLSGVPIPGELPADASLAAAPKGDRIPAFWGCGGQDPFFPGDALDHVRAWTDAHTDMTAVISPQLAHGIDPVILDNLGRWLRDRAR